MNSPAQSPGVAIIAEPIRAMGDRELRGLIDAALPNSTTREDVARAWIAVSEMADRLTALRAALAQDASKITRLYAALTEIANASDKPADYQWRDQFGDYEDCDPTNNGDVHSHGFAEGQWHLALKARAALPQPEKTE